MTVKSAKNKLSNIYLRISKDVFLLFGSLREWLSILINEEVINVLLILNLLVLRLGALGGAGALLLIGGVPALRGRALLL